MTRPAKQTAAAQTPAPQDPIAWARSRLRSIERQIAECQQRGAHAAASIASDIAATKQAFEACTPDAIPLWLSSSTTGTLIECAGRLRALVGERDELAALLADYPPATEAR